MKIAIFTDCYLDLTGGIVTAINAERDELERRGHTVYIFSSSYPRNDVKRQELAKQNIFPVPSCRFFGRGATPIARRPRVIEKWLLANYPEIRDFDIFYVHYEAGCSIAGLRLARELKIPSIQVMHGREDVGEAHIIPLGFRTVVAIALNWFHSWYIPHLTKIHRDDYFAKTLAAAKMWTLMVNHANYADLVITPSNNFRDILKHYGVTREIIALHHGVPDELVSAPAKLHAREKGEPLRIIWHSRVSGEKRILPFLEALYRLDRAPHPTTYHLEVYGDGPDLPLARAYAKMHKQNVTFYGNADYATIRKALESAHIDVLASYNYDTFGMILIEAEASGVPVFIVDPALCEVIPAGGYVLAGGPTPEHMVSALSELIDYPGKISQMSEIMLKNRHAVKISVSVTRLEEIFNRLGGAPHKT